MVAFFIYDFTKTFLFVISKYGYRFGDYKFVVADLYQLFCESLMFFGDGSGNLRSLRPPRSRFTIYRFEVNNR